MDYFVIKSKGTKKLNENLKWTTNISNVAKKAKLVLGFLIRNLRYCPSECKKTAYISMVRSLMGYDMVNSMGPVHIYKHQ